MIRLLKPEGRGLRAIGDPDQAIYGFRGSESGHFLRFAEEFPAAAVHELRRNYRSSAAIVEAAGGLVAPVRSELRVQAVPGTSPGPNVQFTKTGSAAAEAEFITHEIEKWLGGTALFSLDSRRVGESVASTDLGLGDCAILVRTRSLVAPIAAALERLGLPVQRAGASAFIEQAGARALVEAFRVASRRSAAPRSVGDVFREVIEAGYPGGPPAPELARECERLAAGFEGDVTGFLDRVLLRSAVERFDARAEKVAVLTLHAAKGLEWPVVFHRRLRRRLHSFPPGRGGGTRLGRGTPPALRRNDPGAARAVPDRGSQTPDLRQCPGADPVSLPRGHPGRGHRDRRKGVPGAAKRFVAATRIRVLTGLP